MKDFPRDFPDRLERLYGSDALPSQLARWTKLADRLDSFSPGDRASVRFFSSPGRTELGGNHTDHNQGRVLAGAVSLDCAAAVRPRSDGTIRIDSEGHEPILVELSDLGMRREEEGRSAALVRGVAAWFAGREMRLGGFDAALHGMVLAGSGLSSSASFEVLIASILDGLWNDKSLNFIDIAIAGQWAENNYFGKPCGLMDQLACACGGVALIDFADPSRPRIERVTAGFAGKGYSLCIVNVGESHEDLSAEYASIPAEMKAVARHFGKDTLSALRFEDIERELPELRARYGDRAVLRAMHFFDETARPPLMADALRSGDFGAYLDQVRASGASSLALLQNIHVPGAVKRQATDLALALMGRFLGGEGAVRVHGGGFGGTVQAYVPHALLPSFKARVEAVFGRGSVSALELRDRGVCEL